MDVTRLAGRLFPREDGPGYAALRTMVVDAVNGDGTADLTTGDVAVSDVPYLDSVTVTPGDHVQVLTTTGRLLIIGRIATS